MYLNSSFVTILKASINLRRDVNLYVDHLLKKNKKKTKTLYTNYHCFIKIINCFDVKELKVMVITIIDIDNMWVMKLDIFKRFYIYIYIYFFFF